MVSESLVKTILVKTFQLTAIGCRLNCINSYICTYYQQYVRLSCGGILDLKKPTVDFVYRQISIICSTVTVVSVLQLSLDYPNLGYPESRLSR